MHSFISPFVAYSARRRHASIGGGPAPVGISLNNLQSFLESILMQFTLICFPTCTSRGVLSLFSFSRLALLLRQAENDCFFLRFGRCVVFCLFRVFCTSRSRMKTPNNRPVHSFITPVLAYSARGGQGSIGGACSGGHPLKNSASISFLKGNLIQSTLFFVPRASRGVLSLFSFSRLALLLRQAENTVFFSRFAQCAVLCLSCFSPPAAG